MVTACCHIEPTKCSSITFAFLFVQVCVVLVLVMVLLEHSDGDVSSAFTWSNDAHQIFSLVFTQYYYCIEKKFLCNKLYRHSFTDKCSADDSVKYFYSLQNIGKGVKPSHSHYFLLGWVHTFFTHFFVFRCYIFSR